MPNERSRPRRRGDPVALAHPIRTCVGCRGTTGKYALIRVVEGADGPVVDPDGGAPGRGGYVHPDASCVTAALERRAFERALRIGPPMGEAVRLRNELEQRMGAM